MTRAQALQATALVALHDAFPCVDELEPARVDWIVCMVRVMLEPVAVSTSCANDGHE